MDAELQAVRPSDDGRSRPVHAGRAPPPRATAARPSGYAPRPFRPAPWLPGAHAQTLAGRWLRGRGSPPYERERWRTPDGDFLDLDVWRGDGGSDRSGSGRGRQDGARRARVLVLHGLEGCSRSACVVETCRRLAQDGLVPVALNFRSRSGEPNRARRFYHSGETGDLSFVLDRLARRAGGAPVGAVGYSLGGNVLLKYLGERGADARRRLDAAVAVSVPFRLEEAARAMEGGVARLYGSYFVRSLRRSVRRKARATRHDYDTERIGAAATLRQFDDAFTAPVHGFEDAGEYYRRCSSAGHLSDVRVPTLVLHARDDPFLPAGAIPEAALERNPWLVPRITGRGGHVGFVEGPTPWHARFWAEGEATRFLTAALDVREEPVRRPLSRREARERPR